MKKANDKVLLCLMAGVLLAGSISLTAFPAPRISEQENRTLADLPAFSGKTLAAGEYTAGLDAYATERFPFRLPLRTARAVLQIGTGRQEVGGVLLCTDGSLARRISVNEGGYRQNLTALQKLQNIYGEKLTVAVAPRRIDARREVLPPLYDTAEDAGVWETLQQALPGAVTFPSLTADTHWYRTDHHWSTEGAYLAYCALGERLGYTPYPAESFTKETVSTNFRGTSDAAAGLPFVAPDRIELYRYTGDLDYTVTRDGETAPFAGFYDTAKLQTRDQYAVFFGGNRGVMRIENKTERPTLLVIKDSFANAMLPFLALHYRIVAVDPRYTAKGIQSFAEGADAILCLCGMQTLCGSAVFRTWMS